MSWLSWSTVGLLFYSSIGLEDFGLRVCERVRERRKGWIRKYEYSASKKLRRFLLEAFFERPREREMVAYKQRGDTGSCSRNLGIYVWIK